MTFEIFCTSAEPFPREEILPCEGAFVTRKEECKDWRGHYRISYGIELESIDDLLKLAKACGHPIIVDAEEMSLEIYNDYRE